MPTAPGFADVSVQMVAAGMSRPAYITFGVDATDTNPNTIAVSVNLALIASGSITSKLDNGVAIPQIRVSLGTDGSEDLIGIGSFATTGALSQSSVPANVAVLVHKTTTRGGRRGRGRMFIPWFVDEASVDEAGIIGTTPLSGLQGAVDSFLAALAVQTVPMVLLHSEGVTAPGAPNPVTKLSVDKLISTQRRRLGRR